jgi:hypothetical protein
MVSAAWQGWLRARPTLLFVLITLGVPNLLFLLLDASGVGIPPRTNTIVGYVAVGLIARRAPPWLIILIGLLVVAFDVAAVIAASFNFTLAEIVEAARFGAELKITASPFYVLLGLGPTMTAAAFIWLLLREREALRRARLVPVILTLILVAAGDFALKASPHYHFAAASAIGEPFESAVEDSGFAKDVLAPPHRDVLLVLVEGLGVFDNPAHQKAVLAPFFEPEIQFRYDVSTGRTKYFGSTTAGEMRELCGTRDPYTDYLDRDASGCLSQRLSQAGYRTVGLHAFSGRMFSRNRWWTHVGLAGRIFESDMPGAPTCGQVFKGACDSAAIRWVAGALDSDGPDFVYWVTLNSHVPIRKGEHSGTFACTPDSFFGPTDICHLANMWRDLFEDVAELAQDRTLEILLVGDHAPPLWPRREREMFLPGKVTWVRLAPRPSSDPADSARRLEPRER